ncbi:MAG: SGNH/GDSL hydrolase family protein [Clostridiales bacterium]|nr:SGNH/GDSL hydrolase family protein [Clostridiales bacterium]
MKNRYGILIMVGILLSMSFSGCHDKNPATVEQVSSNLSFEELSSDMNEVTASNAEISSLVDEALTEQASTSAKVSSDKTLVSSERAKASSALATSSKRQEASSAPVLQKSENNMELIGRFSEVSSGKYQFEWSGSTITAGFEGTEISILLRTMRLGPYGTEDYFNVSVDGGKAFVLKVQQGTEKYQLAKNLKNGYHTVRITKRTEAQFGSLIQFEGFDYGSGKAAPAPARKNRRIEIYGDSISAGYGNEGTEPGFRLNEENADLTYGALAAKALDAEYTDIALSGHGVYVSLSGSTTEVVPKYFERMIYKEPVTYRFIQSPPDVVIINLGTNDYAMNVNDGNYYKAYLDFIAKIRKKYPKAYIVCTTCGGTDKPLDLLTRVVDTRKEQYKDQKIGQFFGIIEDTQGAFGADGHPSVYGHQQLADQLAEYLKEVMNW